MELHEVGIVHRDLKFENIMIDQNINTDAFDKGTGIHLVPEQITLIDFGFAEFTSRSSGLIPSRKESQEEVK